MPRGTRSAETGESAGRILQVALPVPLRHHFDYLCPPAHAGAAPPRPGVRVRVPFGRTTLVGVVLGLGERSALPAGRLRPVSAVLDEAPLLSAADLALLAWASRYYHHPVGEVVAAALPALLRSPRSADMHLTRVYRAAPGALAARIGPRQRRLLEALEAAPGGLSADALEGAGASLRALLARGLVHYSDIELARSPPAGPPAQSVPPVLNADQQAAVDRVLASAGGFAPLLLEGVTGSGKTEVYLRALIDTLARGGQALVLVPEIGLTQQSVARFRARLPGRLVVYHSGLSELERARAWMAARSGAADVVLGTRSAVWIPMPRLALLVVDEEHDGSYKQQEGFRYNARDVAVMRARAGALPVVLGSATPSLESLQNVNRGRYTHARLPERAGEARPPGMEVVDLRGQPLREGLSLPLLSAMEACLAAGGQSLLFVNRRGFAPLLLCHACGWSAECRHCDSRLIVHEASGQLRCHHCDARQPLPACCPGCGAASLLRIGQGTERVEQALRQRFPSARVLRIDSDTTRRRGSLDGMLSEVDSGRVDILVGTQMLSKGHHFPGVTLVGIVEADSRLHGIDFRAPERLAQLITQVAGRAGRGQTPGRVLVQTHLPEHPLLRQLLEQGYPAFARDALSEREQAELPPFGALALLRAEAPSESHWQHFLDQARALPPAAGPVRRLGPVPAPMARRAGRYRGQLLLSAARRQDMQAFLEDWLPRLEGLPGVRRVRWSLDVDPLDLY